MLPILRLLSGPNCVNLRAGKLVLGSFTRPPDAASFENPGWLLVLAVQGNPASGSSRHIPRDLGPLKNFANMRASFRREPSKLPRSSPRVVREFARDLRRLEILGFVVLAIGICGMVLISATSAGRGAAEPMPLYVTPAPAPPSSTAISVSTESHLRFYYQYSVIPGGVQSADELREAVADDAVVADHYADFGLKHVNFVTLGRDQAFYVSYRLPTGVYWTSRPMLLHRGEKLVTDGFNLARVRCGNRLSEVPLAPISPIQPAPEEMNVASVVRAPQGILHPAHLLHRPPIVFVPIIPFFIPPGGSGPPPFFAFAPLPAANAVVVLVMISLTLLLRFALRRRMAAQTLSGRRPNRELLRTSHPMRRSSDCESPTVREKT